VEEPRAEVEAAEGTGAAERGCSGGRPPQSPSLPSASAVASPCLPSTSARSSPSMPWASAAALSVSTDAASPLLASRGEPRAAVSGGSALTLSAATTGSAPAILESPVEEPRAEVEAAEGTGAAERGCSGGMPPQSPLLPSASAVASPCLPSASARSSPSIPWASAAALSVPAPPSPAAPPASSEPLLPTPAPDAALPLLASRGEPRAAVSGGPVLALSVATSGSAPAVLESPVEEPRTEVDVAGGTGAAERGEDDGV